MFEQKIKIEVMPNARHFHEPTKRTLGERGSGPIYAFWKVENADFFSLSACRDLLFHSQEHRYTIPRIKKEIKKLGLKFLGFQHPNNTIISKFNDIYIDEKAYLNLDYWEEFENNYSDTFSTMYQFWVQKKVS